MSGFKRLFKQTFIYGLATVLPRMLTFLLVPLYTEVLAVGVYGKVSIIFSWFAIFNVILAYGMETAFFRFFNKEENKNAVVSTSTLSILFTSLGIFLLAFLLREQISLLIDIKVEHINYVVWILLLDALVIIPFAWLRANEKPMRYAIIKITNVAINIGLNLFFLLWLKGLVRKISFLEPIYKPNFEISYILIATLIASALTLVLMVPFYSKVSYKFHPKIWRQMLKYAFPVLIAGLAFTINETFNRILLDSSLSNAEDPEREVGMFSACYKLALFMTLFATAFRLGIEPYFFSHAKTDNPQKNYARILEYFVALGSVILLVVVVFADVIKVLIIRDEAFWEAMWIVPIILIASFCLGIYHNLSVWYKITDRTKFGAYISVFGAIVTLALNFWLIPIIGYKGSAIATLAAYGSMVLLSYFYGRKYYPIPYNLKKISLYLSISIIFSLFSFYQFRENYTVGISMLIIFGLMVYILEKKTIMLFLRR
ncbi:lipopolysaccharide biosynthesis protein [Winogradskyella immobilis]|uniref:Oligosaccharide flippase family protein n=1 Tax=Winogradskyella immobilis TaxID=2816852 RepID=A0ABS8EQT3_9FLAO|nr:oligosaccharide flippase family protein [Winogradskyella immobilis]MCC1485594.1 oligosaccharide flippase family protein [Winogradskyella immobilis]MCG0017686.1 oligosaccharide flippase family protein [Winogradskyella immobilis]